MNDFRFAVRQLRKSPGFAAVAIITLALGIGATTAIFSVVNAVLLNPLDYPESDRLVQVFSRNLQRGHLYQVSGPDFADWKAAATNLDGFSRYYRSDTAVSSQGSAETIGAAHVSMDFFSVLGTALRAGRMFDAGEWSAGGAAIIGESLAQRLFGGAANALGQSVTLYGRKITVVGVLPAGFSFPNKTEAWLPIDTVFPLGTSRTGHNSRTLARLKPGITLERAQQEMDAIAAQLRAAHPNENSTKGAGVVRLLDYTVRNHRSTLWILLGSVALLLVLACANVANLLLARGAARTREVAVRAALGGSVWQIVRSLLAEGVVLSVAAALFGIFLGWIGTKTLVALAPTGIPRLDKVALDGQTLLFTAGVTILVCLLAALVPAWQSAKPDLNLALRAGGNKGMIGGAGHRLRSGLVVMQLAISLLLLCGAGLFVRSLRNLELVDPGYRPEGVLVMTANFPVSTKADEPRAAAFYAELLREARNLPGANAVSYAREMPIDDVGSNGTYFTEENPNLPNNEWDKYSAIWRVAGPDYFSTMGIRIIQGRGIEERDGPGATLAVVVNESMARTAWPGQNPIGRRVKLGWMQSTYENYLTVVGVCADIKQVSLDAPSRQELYIAGPQHPQALERLKLVVRTTAAPLSLAEPLRQLVRRLNPEVPVQFTTATIMIRDNMAAPRFRTVLIGVFAGVALLLAIVGVAGVLACMVTERRSEIAIRMALGALPGDVVGDFVRRGVRLALFGLAVGLISAYFGARLLQGLLFGVGTSDPSTFAIVGGVLMIAALVASAVPAARAAKVDPLVVLRAE